MKIKTLLFGTLLATSVTGNAATLYVDVHTGSDNDNTCNNRETPCHTLSHAYDKSNPNDVIQVAKGEYQQLGCQLEFKHPITVKGGFNSSFDPQLKEANPLDTIFRVSKDEEMCRFLVVNSGTNGWVELDSLTIQDAGLASTPAHSGTILMLANYSSGGGNNYDGNQLRLNNVIMRDNNNQKEGAAGAIAIADGSENKLEIINSRFLNNKAKGDGGAVAIAGDTELLIQKSEFTSNQTDYPSSGNGGAIFIDGEATVDMTIEDSLFKENKGRFGGSIHFKKSVGNYDSQFLIERSSFVDNKSYNHGGNIYAEGGSFIVRNSTFNNNETTGGQGGALAFIGAEALLQYNTFVGNKANKSGGAIGLWYNNKTKAEFLANLITGNKDNQSGNESSIWLYSPDFTDAGYNIIGEGNMHGITDQNHAEITQTIYDANFNHKVSGNNTTVILEGSASDVLEVSAEYNGAVDNQIELLTHKIKKGGAAHNAIPNDGIPFYGVGTDPANPFISLLQASATIGLDDTHYKPNKIFYFDLGGSYNEETNEFTAGSNGTLIFSAEVDADGWVRRAGLGSVGDDVETRTDNENPPREWARQVGGICSGLIATDGRGMPRSDKAKAEVSATRCDVGAFEFNDYFKLDCFDEDGMRPENNIKSFNVSWCFNPAENDLSPQDVFENMGIGSFYWHWSLFLLAVLGFRLRVK